VALLLAAVLSGCEGGGNGNPDGALSCTEPKSLCANLFVPQGFSGTPTTLMALFFKSLPPAGAPDAFLATQQSPVIGPAHPYELEAQNVSATGTFYFYAVLYMEGGGTMEPVPGVDYVGTAPDPVVSDGTPLNLGDIQLQLYQEP
jgi:hypothetical protein